MSILEGLRFQAGDTVIHKIDPRVKFLLSLFMLTVAVMFVEIPVLTILVAVQAGMAYAAQVIRSWARTLRGALPLAVLVFVLNVVFLSTSEGFISSKVLYQSAALAYRLVVFLSSFSVFFLTTTPEEIGLTLTSWRVPYTYTFAFISAIRFTPVIGQELKTIMDAQRSRGLELDRGGPLERVRKFIPILVPLLASALRRSYELAEAMEVKCFGATKKRTSLKELKMRRADYAALFLATCLFALSVFGRIYLL